MKHDSKPGPENSVSAKSRRARLTMLRTTNAAPPQASRAWHTLSAEEVSWALHNDPARA